MVAKERAAQLIAEAYRVLMRDIVALIFFTLVGLAAMYPVILQPRARVGGAPGDNIQYAYMTGWAGRLICMAITES